MLLRGEIALYHVDKNPEHINFFIKYADNVWNEERNKNGLIGKPGKRKALIDQAAMIEIYARLAQLDIWIEMSFDLEIVLYEKYH